jgi:hypothetical protein
MSEPCTLCAVGFRVMQEEWGVRLHQSNTAEGFHCTTTVA